MSVIRRALTHLRRHAIAYLALFLALAGASYAATTPTANPAATTPPSVKHWAHVSKTGKILASSAGGRTTVLGGSVLNVSWGVSLSAKCVPLVTLDVTMGPGATGGSGGFAGAGIGGTNVVVKTFNDRSRAVLQPFYIAVICP